jgi:Ca-activated chloride channel family protein
MTFFRKHSSFQLAALALLLFTAVPAQPQETSKPAQAGAQPAMVLLNVRITDEAGHPVSDVRQEEMRVSEDGVPQTISFFSKEELPLSYGLVIDSSGSLRSQMDKVVDAGRIVVNSNSPNDETFLIRFISTDKIQLVTAFTSSKVVLFNALDSLYVEGGLTAVMDAVYVAVEAMAKSKRSMDGSNRRRALVLITDGEDRGSRYKRTQLAELLHKEDIQIFVIGLTNQIEERRAREKALDLLSFLAKETGGRAFFPNSVSELRGIAEEITRDLRTQYLIGYTPTGGNQSNTFHKVQVTVAESQGKEKLVGVTRVGYIAAPRQ